MATSPLRSARARLRVAQSETMAAEAGFRREAAVLRAWFDQHRTACIVAGGFVGGLALSSLPRRAWSRIGAVAGGGAAALARSLLTPMIAGALLARRQAASATTAPAGDAAAPP